MPHRCRTRRWPKANTPPRSWRRTWRTCGHGWRASARKPSSSPRTVLGRRLARSAVSRQRGADMESQSTYTDIVQGYVDLASDLLERWTTQAGKVASKLDSRSYKPDTAMADLAATATLATETGFLFASEALEALAICTERERGPYYVDSDPFYSPAPGATLQLEGPLVGLGAVPDQLPVSVIEILPSSALGPNDTEFRLQANATGHQGITYAGRVTASWPGAADQKVPVWIVVP